MNMNIKYSKLDNTNFTIEEVLELIHEVFSERVDEGMNFFAARMTLDQFKKKLKNTQIFVAYDEETNTLLGTGCLQICRQPRGVKYGYLFNLAVRSKAKRQGVASTLYQYRERECIDNECAYITSDTAIMARSSINYHFKNGFKIVGLRSWITTNYYSYIFRKQLKSPSNYYNNWFCRIQFVKSAIKTILLYRKDGSRRF